MPIDPNGSKPERMDIPGQDFVAQNYTAKEVEHLPGKPNNWRVKKKCGLPNPKKLSDAYRSGWDRIWGGKKDAEGCLSETVSQGEILQESDAGGGVLALEQHK